MKESVLQSKAETIITPDRPIAGFWQEIFRYKDLFYFLAWRDFKVRYKQTVMGVAWAVIRPLLTMIVFSIVFGRLAELPSEGVPYPLLVFTAMLPWYFFSSGFQDSSNALIANANMISKIYFPRIILPLSTIFVNLADFCISFALLLFLLAIYGINPDWKIVLLPLFLLMAGLAALGAGLWFCALNVSYRDFRYIVPFIVQLGLYISPVGFSSSVVPERWRLIFSINPMVGVIDCFRWAINGAEINFYGPGVMLSFVATLILFTSGIWFFQKTERQFADII